MVVCFRIHLVTPILNPRTMEPMVFEGDRNVVGCAPLGIATGVCMCSGVGTGVCTGVCSGVGSGAGTCKGE